MVKKKIKKSRPGKKPSIQRSWIYLLLAFIAGSLYINTLFHDYVLDDAIMITENVFTKKGIAGLGDIFSHDTFYGFFQKEGKDKLVSGGRYRPFSQAMFAVEYSLFGLNPLIGHLMNIMLYMGTVCSLFFVLSHFCKRFLDASEVWLFAGISALVFTVHPIHTEVVANIKGRDEILVLLFSIWSLYFTSKFVAKKQIKFAIYSGATFLIALFSKENAVAFLGVIPITLFLFEKRKFREIVAACLPPVFGLLIYLFVRYLVVGLDFGGSPPLELMNNPFVKLTGSGYALMTIHEKAPLIILGMVKYLQLLFFPTALTHDYYPKYFSPVNWSHPMVILGIVLMTTIGLFCISYLRRYRVICFSILFFFGTIFLTSNILFPVGTHLSERFLYTPSIAFALVFTSFVWWLKSKIGLRRSCWMILPLLILLTYKTIGRNHAWKNNYTLFTTDVRTSSKSAKMQNAVGGVMIEESRNITDTATRNDELRDAIGHLQKAVEIHPGYKNAYLLLGNAHYYLGKYQLAIYYFEQALRLDPNYEEALYNLSFAYRDLGRYYGETLGDLNRALEYLKKAHEKLQDDYETVRLLGIAYGNLGQPEKSIDYFKQALSLKPKDGWTHYNLGLAYLALQDTINANRYISEAKFLNPEIGK